MNFEFFCQELIRLINELLPENCHAELTKVTKNNNTVMTAMAIRSESNAAPTLYLDEIYRNFCEDEQSAEKLEQLAKNLIELLHKQPEYPGCIVDNITNYDSIKNNLCFRLINTAQNTEQLKDYISVPFLDLSLVVMCAMDDKLLATTVVTRSLAALWNVSKSDILLAAAANSPSLLPPVFRPLSDMFPDYLLNELPASLKLQVLTNSFGLYGAACIAYPDVLERICTQVKGSFFIIPSSIHEIIIHPGEYREKDSIDQMVRAVNEEAVPKTCFLSDHSYYYDSQLQKIIY